MAMRRTPGGVGAPHIPDKLTNFFRDSGTTRLGALTQALPVVSEALVLPGDDGSGLDKLQGVLPARPQPEEPYL